MRLRIALCVLSLLAITACRSGSPLDQGGSAQFPPNDWVMADHDAQHTNRSSFAGPENPHLKWTYSHESDPVAVSAILYDGGVYATCGRWLLAFNAQGEVRWRTESPQYFGAAPVVGPDGAIYTTAGQLLRAYSPDGELKWSVTSAHGEFTQPAAGADGRTYAIAGGSELYAANAAGELLWTYALLGETGHPPLVDDGGRIYVMSRDGEDYYLTALSPNHEVLWQLHEPGYELSAPALGPDSLVCIGLYNPALFEPGIMPYELLGELAALNADGTRAWSYEVTSGLPDKILVSWDDLVYATSRELFGSLFVLNVDGELVGKGEFGAWTTMELVSITSDGRAHVIIRDCDWGLPYYAVFSLDGTMEHYEVSDRIDPQAPLHFHTSGASIGVYRGHSADVIEYRNADDSLKWSAKPGLDARQVLLSPDGGIILGTDKLTKLDRSGSVLWSRDLKMDSADVAISADGTIVALGEKYNANAQMRDSIEVIFTAISSQGSEIWRQSFDPYYSYYGPVLAADGSIYIATGGRLLAYAPSGELSWELELRDVVSPARVMPALGHDGTIYLACHGSSISGLIIAANPDGTEKWRQPSERFIDRLMVADDGRLLIEVNSVFSCRAADGTLLWETEVTENSYACGISPHGALLIRTSLVEDHQQTGSMLRWLTPAGQWQQEGQLSIPAAFYVSEVITDSARRIYVAQHAAEDEPDVVHQQSGIYVYSEAGELLWNHGNGIAGWGMAIGGDGTLYFTGDSQLFALGD